MNVTHPSRGMRPSSLRSSSKAVARGPSLRRRGIKAHQIVRLLLLALAGLVAGSPWAQETCRNCRLASDFPKESYWKYVLEQRGQEEIEAPSTGNFGTVQRVTLRDMNSDQKIVFNVPNDYFQNPSVFRGRTGELASFVVLLPALEPNGASVRARHRRSSRGYPARFLDSRNKVNITIWGSITDVRTGRNKLRRLDRTRVLSPNQVYGLSLYEKKLCEPEVEAAVAAGSSLAEAIKEYSCRPADRMELFSEQGSEGRWIHIGCSRRPRADLSSGCTARTTYRDRRLSYIFRKSELAHWNTIDRAIHALLSSFDSEE